MDTLIDRRRLLLASMALGGAGSAQSQSSTAPDAPPHPDLALKLIIVGRRKPGTTLAEHRQHIRRVHGELVLKNIAVDPANAPRRYVQHQVLDGSYRAAAPGTDPFALNRDFVTQIWFPDLASLGRARKSAYFIEHIRDDEDNFVDQATVVFMPVRERVMSGVAVPAANRIKLFGLLQRAPGVSLDDFRKAWRPSAALMSGSAQPLRHVQNDTLPTPAGAPAADGIDEFWFDDEAAARSFLTRWQAWVADTLVRPGLSAAGSQVVLLAQEDVLHAGPR